MKKFKHIHFIGIKGIAMTALALLAKGQGTKITGSDIAEEFITDQILEKNNIKWSIGFSEKNIIGKPDLVVVTGAHGGMTNPEAVAAKLLGFNVIMQGQALGLFMKGFTQISVVGCHGKTTTSALIAFLLEKAGISPSFAIGCADIPSLGSSAKNGHGKLFVAEADEYVTCPKTDKTPRFLWQEPQYLVITNIEYDHPDVYQDINEVKDAFRKIALKVPENGYIIAYIDNQNVKDVVSGLNNVITYGGSPLADWRIKRVYFNEGFTNFWLEYKGREIGDFRISLPGEHNAYNATAALIVALQNGVTIDKVKEILPQFTGTKRRFEKVGETNNIQFYDDYAHHPTEISATLNAAKEWFPDSRLIVIFQPHTFSRTKALFSEFAHSFTKADIVIIADIYNSARETDCSDISPEHLVQETSKFHPACYYLKGEIEVSNFLQKKALPGDIIITMGAGDVYKWNNGIINKIKEVNSSN